MVTHGILFCKIFKSIPCLIRNVSNQARIHVSGPLKVILNLECSTVSSRAMVSFNPVLPRKFGKDVVSSLKILNFLPLFLKNHADVPCNVASGSFSLPYFFNFPQKKC